MRTTEETTMFSTGYLVVQALLALAAILTVIVVFHER
jgi:hypothetical protein